MRISDLVIQPDPPQARQPAGTTVVIELRGADAFDKSGAVNPTGFLYDPLNNDEPFDQATVPPIVGRGNLLNPNYACEAYRYSKAGSGGARVPATGLTRYVTDTQIAAIRNPATGLLPRYLNLRLVMSNNVDVSPALSPSLRSLSLIYRMQVPQ
jgi:hypothetical protein